MSGAEAPSGELTQILAQRHPPRPLSTPSGAASGAAAPAAPGDAGRVGADNASPSDGRPPRRDNSAAVMAPAVSGPLVGWRIAFAPDVSLFKTCNDSDADPRRALRTSVRSKSPRTPTPYRY